MKRLVGMTFAAPAVSSFTMSGIEAVFGSGGGALAAAPNTSPSKRSEYTTSIGCLTMSPNQSKTQSFGDGARNVQLTVPGTAFTRPTTVCVYRGELDQLEVSVPDGETPVSAYSVVWTNDLNQRPKAFAPLSIDVTDPAVSDGDPVYVIDSGSPVLDGSASTGDWGATFINDPHYVVTHVFPPEAPPTEPPDSSADAGAATPVVAQPRTSG